MRTRSKSNALQKPTDDLLKNSIKTGISGASPSLLAWCSHVNNKISIVELKQPKQKFSNFDGARISKVDFYGDYSHVKEIANTGLLVSIHHCYSYFANLEVFDVSRKGQARKIYSLEEVSGVTGFGDVTYNPRRNILGAIPVGAKIAYHLYNLGSSKTGHMIELIRKSRLKAQDGSKSVGLTTSFDFNPHGETAATIDCRGTCSISDVNTNNSSFRHKMEMILFNDLQSRCRWSTNPDEPLLFVKYDGKQLNIIDVEKKALTLKSPIQLNRADRDFTSWIDVCQRNGNLLASGGGDKSVKIFDKRESKIVQTFESIHKGTVWCVRWSPSGDMLASASADKTVKVLDPKAGEKVYAANSDECKFSCS